MDSVLVYRVEIGAVVFLGSYVVAIALCLAYQGRSVGRIAVPGGGELEAKDPALNAAADGMADFQAATQDRFASQDESLAALDARLVALEDRRMGERLSALEDRS